MSRGVPGFRLRALPASLVVRDRVLHSSMWAADRGLGSAGMVLGQRAVLERMLPQNMGKASLVLGGFSGLDSIDFSSDALQELGMDNIGFRIPPSLLDMSQRHSIQLGTDGRVYVDNPGSVLFAASSQGSRRATTLPWRGGDYTDVWERVKGLVSFLVQPYQGIADVYLQTNGGTLVDQIEQSSGTLMTEYILGKPEILRVGSNTNMRLAGAENEFLFESIVMLDSHLAAAKGYSAKGNYKRALRHALTAIWYYKRVAFRQGDAARPEDAQVLYEFADIFIQRLFEDTEVQKGKKLAVKLFFELLKLYKWFDCSHLIDFPQLFYRDQIFKPVDFYLDGQGRTGYNPDTAIQTHSRMIRGINTPFQGLVHSALFSLLHFMISSNVTSDRRSIEESIRLLSVLPADQREGFDIGDLVVSHAGFQRDLRVRKALMRVRARTYRSATQGLQGIGSIASQIGDMLDSYFKTMSDMISIMGVVFLDIDLEARRNQIGLADFSHLVENIETARSMQVELADTLLIKGPDFGFKDTTDSFWAKVREFKALVSQKVSNGELNKKYFDPWLARLDDVLKGLGE